MLAVKKITVLFNEVTKLDVNDEKAILTEAGAKDDAEIITNALIKRGYDAEIFQVTENSVNELQNHETDIYFNLCDGIGNILKSEHKIPEMLELWKRPYTGSDSRAMQLTTDKVATKELFIKNNIPTPKYIVYDKIPDEPPKDLFFPMIVKPAREDCSTGIYSNSVVKKFNELKIQSEKIINEFHQEALVEEYIDGKELNATMLGCGDSMKVMPIAEILFGKSYDDGSKPKIIDFDAKWLDGSVNDLETTSKYPADISEEVRSTVSGNVMKAMKLCNARDYARADMRLGNNGVCYFLEINVNPDLYPGMGASKAAAFSGLSYEEFMEKIILSAATRY